MSNTTQMPVNVQGHITLKTVTWITYIKCQQHCCQAGIPSFAAVHHRLWKQFTPPSLRHRSAYPPTACCKFCSNTNKYLVFFSRQFCRHYYSLLQDSDPRILLEDLLLGCFISRTTTPVSVFSTGRSRMLCWTVSMAILCCNQVFK